MSDNRTDAQHSAIADRHDATYIQEKAVADTVGGFNTMLTAIKGIYRNGIATPVEKVDFDGPSDVLIVFPSMPEPGARFMRSAGTWAGLDTEELKKRITADRAISTRKTVRL